MIHVLPSMHSSDSNQSDLGGLENSDIREFHCKNRGDSDLSATKPATNCLSLARQMRSASARSIWCRGDEFAIMALRQCGRRTFAEGLRVIGLLV